MSTRLIHNILRLPLGNLVDYPQITTVMLDLITRTPNVNEFISSKNRTSIQG